MKLRLANPSNETAKWRLTEDPALFGMVIRERGHLIEYVSYREALKRQGTRPADIPGILRETA
ncbi:MAG: hypothetical protein HN742_06390 [Lentisphaerae bacterium]|jgi:hypothetical protein|nr:hypothetical protein [Lentisphaerota bacterium]MBT4817247.1 hypothetical protein [Lentisphaerota bacterium]MBT5610035.1 hypothetical protein [Lentisphaerota bacterium]MBT7055565.1 hypothetical protein [Lentisphaerota bacterium]MBT7841480.1 hypothetical protein [Lentisphaerota bacterium]